MSPVVVPDLLPQCAIAGGRAELLDPRVFIRRNCLIRELAPYPVRLLRQDDPTAEASGGEGSGASA
jgi:hypothetical protein